jgi:hypothetical protein
LLLDLQAKHAVTAVGTPLPGDAAEALAAADGLLAILRAASDVRSVKAVVPEADAAQLLTGDTTQRAQVSGLIGQDSWHYLCEYYIILRPAQACGKLMQALHHHVA